MHLRSLVLENFRCFRRAEYEFPRITLLTGENSSGKSTVINGLLAILQGSSRESYPFSLTANGDLCTMGGYREIVYGGNERLNVGVGLRTGVGSYIGQPREQWDMYANYMYLKGKRQILPKTIRVSAKEGTFTAEQGQDGRYTVEFRASEDSAKQVAPLLENLLGTLEKVALSDVEKGKELHRLPKPKFNRELKTSRVSKLSNSRHARALFRDEILYHTYIHRLEESLRTTRSWVRYLGPARLYPDRYYFDRTPSQLRIGPRGEQIAGTLFRWQASEPKKLRQLVKYLNELELALDLKPKYVKANVLQVMVSITRKLPAASLEDVGFGLSQVLPMLVLDVDLGKGGTLLMSQPELHLHPSAQASIADYVFRRTKDLNRQYVIETHSEYLLNRFRVLVAKGEIPEEDIALYYLLMEGDEAKTTRVQIKKDGTLSGAPADFFDTYRLDAFNLAMSL